MARSLIVLLALSALIATFASPARAAEHSDAAGEAGAAPDIARVSVEPTESALTFRIVLAAADPLADGGELFLALDADGSAATGDRHGVELVYSLRAGGLELRARRWSGVEHAPFTSSATGRVEGAVVTFVVQRAELGSPAAIGFGAVGVRGSDADAAPENGSWAFRLRETARVSSVQARWPAAGPVAGRTFRLLGASGRLSDGTTRRGAATCRARLAGRLLPGRGCRWLLPPQAKGRRLAVTVRLRVAGVGTATRTLRFRVA
jgi:hypothetical protein